MPFSGESSNLPNHTHDQTITEDGGALDLSTNSTSGSLAAASITYSDATGAHMEELTIGTPGQVLSVSAGSVPEWAAAGSSGASCSDVLVINGQSRTLCTWLEIAV
tara:strand:- start:142 stop:459 length:318 start_codon:yes stop_codon:yes gene_type:complete